MSLVPGQERLDQGRKPPSTYPVTVDDLPSSRSYRERRDAA